MPRSKPAKGHKHRFGKVQRESLVAKKRQRGNIQILDLEALREAACECYATVNSNYQALLGLPLQDE